MPRTLSRLTSGKAQMFLKPAAQFGHASVSALANSSALPTQGLPVEKTRSPSTSARELSTSSSSLMWAGKSNAFMCSRPPSESSSPAMAKSERPTPRALAAISLKRSFVSRREATLFAKSSKSVNRAAFASASDCARSDLSMTSAPSRGCSTSNRGRALMKDVCGVSPTCATLILYSSLSDGPRSRDHQKVATDIPALLCNQFFIVTSASCRSRGRNTSRNGGLFCYFQRFIPEYHIGLPRFLYRGVAFVPSARADSVATTSAEKRPRRRLRLERPVHRGPSEPPV